MNSRYLSAAVSREEFAHLPRGSRVALAELATMAHRSGGFLEVHGDVENPFKGLLDSPEDALPLLRAIGGCGPICEVVRVASRTVLVIGRWEAFGAKSSVRRHRGRGRPVADVSDKAERARERQRRYQERKRQLASETPASEISNSDASELASEVPNKTSVRNVASETQVAHPPTVTVPEEHAAKPAPETLTPKVSEARKIVENARTLSLPDIAPNLKALMERRASESRQNSASEFSVRVHDISDNFSRTPISDLRIGSSEEIKTEIPRRSETGRQLDKNCRRDSEHASEIPEPNSDTPSKVLETDRNKFLRCLQQSGFHLPSASESIEDFSAKLIATAVRAGANPLEALSEMIVDLRYGNITPRSNGLLFKKYRDAIRKQQERAARGVEYPAETIEPRRPNHRVVQPLSAEDIIQQLAAGGVR